MLPHARLSSFSYNLEGEKRLKCLRISNVFKDFGRPILLRSVGSRFSTCCVSVWMRFGVFLTHTTTRRNQQRSIRKNGWKWGKFGYNQLVSSSSAAPPHRCANEPTKKRRRRKLKSEIVMRSHPTQCICCCCWLNYEFFFFVFFFFSLLLSLSFPLSFFFLSIHIRHPLVGCWLRLVSVEPMFAFCL